MNSPFTFESEGNDNFELDEFEGVLELEIDFPSGEIADEGQADLEEIDELEGEVGTMPAASRQGASSLTFEAEPFQLPPAQPDRSPGRRTHSGCGCGKCRHRSAEDEEGSWASQYAPDVRQAIELGGAMWPLALQRAITSGIRDPGALANIAFYMQFPGRSGRPISATEPGASNLIAAWKFFRDAAKNMLSPAPSSAPSGVLRQNHTGG